MGSVGSPLGAWAPYDTYKDCSRGICSIYCPQWCYMIFPPPPPLGVDDGSGTPFSPLIIAVIGILASAFLLVSYYTIVTRYCRRRRSRNPNIEFAAQHDEVHQDQWQVATAGLDEAHIKAITVFKYRKSDKLVEGTECAVCLTEFREGESLRLLPKCCHAFHPPCIDTWLKSQSNCPLCRANVNPFNPSSSLPAPNPQTSSTVNISSLEVQRQNDLVFVVEDQEREVAASLSHVCDVLPKDPLQANSEMEDSEAENRTNDDQEGVIQFRRSISFGAFSSQRNLLVADILRLDKDNDGYELEGVSQSGIETGSSNGIQEGQSHSNDRSRERDLAARNPAAMRRSFSTGRFNFTCQDDDDKGKSHILPN